MKVKNYLTISALAAASVSIGHAQIAITEFINNVAGDEDAQEWLELFNFSDSDIDLANWTISDNGASYTLPSFSLASGAYAIIAQSKTSFEANWLGGAENSNVLGDWTFGNLSNSGDQLVLASPSATTVWTLGFPNGESAGRATFLTGNNFSITDFGDDGTPLIIFNGNDGTTPAVLGYEANDATTDLFAFTSVDGDIGSPLAGQYSAVPEPSTIALIALGFGAFLFSLRRRVRA